jgi:hypothetical protein
MYKGLYDKCQIDITNLQEENIKTIGKKDEEFAKVDE